MSEMVGNFKSFFDDNLVSNEDEQNELFTDYIPSFMKDAHQMPSFETLFMQSTASSQSQNSYFANEFTELNFKATEQNESNEEPEDIYEDHHLLRYFLHEKVSRKRSFLIKDGNETSEDEEIYQGFKRTTSLNKVYLIDEFFSEDENEPKLNILSKKIQKVSRINKQGSLPKRNNKSLKNRG